MQIKINELEVRNNNLIKNVSSLKEMTFQIEKSISNKIEFMNSVRANAKSNNFMENDNKYLNIYDKNKHFNIIPNNL